MVVRHESHDILSTRASIGPGFGQPDLEMAKNMVAVPRSRGERAGLTGI